MQARPTLLIVTASEDLKAQLRQTLQSNYQLEVAVSGEEARAMVRIQGPRSAMVLLDVTAPEALPLCDTLDPSLNLMLILPPSALSAWAEILNRLAVDFVLAPISGPELLARLQMRLRREPTTEATIEATERREHSALKFGDLDFDSDGTGLRIDSPGGPIRVSLTHHEFRLLLCLARAGGKILSRENLIKSVWSSETQIIGRTVDTHVCKLRKKISRSRFTIHSVYGAGYRFVEPTDATSASAEI